MRILCVFILVGAQHGFLPLFKFPLGAAFFSRIVVPLIFTGDRPASFNFSSPAALAPTLPTGGSFLRGACHSGGIGPTKSASLRALRTSLLFASWLPFSRSY